MNVIAFIVSIVLFLLGMFLMGSAFAVPEAVRLLVFLGGILITTIGIMIPIHVMKRLNP